MDATHQRAWTQWYTSRPRIMRLAWLLAVFVCSVASLGQAATYHVAKTGSDSVTCANADFAPDNTQAKLTIQAGLDCATAAGDIVEVHVGTYTQNLSAPASGSASAQIILRRYQTDAVFLIGSVNLSNRSYVTVQGLDISGMAGHGITINGGSGVSTGIQILDNTIHDPTIATAVGVRGAPDQVLGSVGYGTQRIVDLLIAGNTIYNMTEDGISCSNCLNLVIRNNVVRNTVNEDGIDIKQNSENILIEGNTVYDNNDSGIMINSVHCAEVPVIGGRAFTIQDNLVYNNGSVAGHSQIHINSKELENPGEFSLIQRNIVRPPSAGNAYDGITLLRGHGVKVLNNVVYGASRFGIMGRCFRNGEIKNNIIMNSAVRAMSFETSSCNCTGYENGLITENYNDFYPTATGFLRWTTGTIYNTLGAYQSATSQGANSISANPLFVSPPTDFHLMAGSPGIGTGEAGIDMGVYPIPPDQIAPAPPTGLSLTVTAQGIRIDCTEPTANSDDTPLMDLTFIRYYRCAGSGCSPIFFRDEGPAGCGYDDTSVLHSTTYLYQVSAVDDDGNESSLSAIEEAITWPPMPATLVGSWPLDEASGTSAGDDSGNGLNGTVAGAAVWDTPGLIFDGVDDLVSVPRNVLIEPTTSVTVCLFVTPNGPQGGNYADLLNKTYQNDTVSPNVSYALMLNSAGLGDTVVSFVIGTASGSQFLHSDVGDVPNLTRVHVCGVYDPAGPAPQLRLYVGGSLDKTANLSEPIVYDATSTGNLYLGSNGGTRFRFKGLLEDVRVYDGAVSDAAIADLALGAPVDVGGFAQSAYCWTRADHPETQACQGNVGTSFKTGIPGRIVQKNQARVRVAISRTVDTSPLTEFVLYARSPAVTGTWWALDDDCSANPFCYGVDGRLANGTNTTAQLVAVGDFAAGGKFYTAGHPRLDQVSIPAGKSLEYEAVIRAATNTSTTTTIGLCMRPSDAPILDANPCPDVEATAVVTAPVSYGP